MMASTVYETEISAADLLGTYTVAAVTAWDNVAANVNIYLSQALTAGLPVGGAVASWLVRSTRSERSGFEPWPGTLCCVLGQDTLLSQCLSPPRCINGYLRIAGET